MSDSSWYFGSSNFLVNDPQPVCNMTYFWLHCLHTCSKSVTQNLHGTFLKWEMEIFRSGRGIASLDITSRLPINSSNLITADGGIQMLNDCDAAFLYVQTCSQPIHGLHTLHIPPSDIYTRWYLGSFQVCPQGIVTYWISMAARQLCMDRIGYVKVNLCFAHDHLDEELQFPPPHIHNNFPPLPSTVLCLWEQ